MTLLQSLAYAIDYPTKGYNYCINKYIKTKEERFKNDAEYWLEERERIIYSYSLKLSDEEYLTLNIY